MENKEEIKQQNIYYIKSAATKYIIIKQDNFIIDETYFSAIQFAIAGYIEQKNIFTLIMYYPPALHIA